MTARDQSNLNPEVGEEFQRFCVLNILTSLNVLYVYFYNAESFVRVNLVTKNSAQMRRKGK